MKKMKQRDVLRLLRNNHRRGFLNPYNFSRVFIYQKYKSSDNENVEPEALEIEVSFKYYNYPAIIRDFYNSDKYGHFFDNEDVIGYFDDFCLVPDLKILIKQLEEDGKLYREKQKVNYYYTDYGLEFIPYADGQHVLLNDGRNFFSKDEQESLETALILTTKGQNRIYFLWDKILSEPIGLFSLVLALISIIISIIAL
ncbi:MAG: hypothetical protein HGA67_04445 [Candidatus Yonathbacteria bacterium]|nr:hypothetical protein [Candidatus Yonathbacteria bacterium]